MRLAYLQRPHEGRLLNVFFRSVRQRPSAPSMASGRSEFAELFAEVTLWRDRPESFFRQEILASYTRLVATLP